MTDYTVRFERGNRGWTCSVFSVGPNGMATGSALASGTGTTKDTARDMALSLASDPAVRIALANADHRRPYWIQGAIGEKQEAQRKAADHPKASPRRLARPL